MENLTRERYERGHTYDEYRGLVEKHQGLWRGVYDHLEVPEDALLRVKELPGRRHVAVLAGDWCGDAASLVPVLAKLVDAAPEALDLRVFDRDEHADLMDRYLTHGGRSIPIAIVFDDEMRELGWWGPRPAPAQAMFRERIREFRAGRLTPAPAQAMFRERIREFRAGRLTDKGEEVFKPLLRWYREDHGRHTIDEFLVVLERGGEPRP
jgi:hypothetical protein